LLHFHPHLPAHQLWQQGVAKGGEGADLGFVLIDFFADWCGPCQVMAPIIERIAQKYPKVKFAKINVDDAQEISTKYEISSIPCFVFFKDGEEVDRVIGGFGQDIFEEKNYVPVAQYCLIQSLKNQARH
jgi:thioredoxin 1